MPSSPYVDRASWWTMSGGCPAEGAGVVPRVRRRSCASPSRQSRSCAGSGSPRCAGRIPETPWKALRSPIFFEPTSGCAPHHRRIDARRREMDSERRELTLADHDQHLRRGMIAADVAARACALSPGAGCVISTSGGDVVSTACDRIPRDLHSTHDRAHESSIWIEHAERAALYALCRRGSARSTEGSTAFLTRFPCIECVRALVQAGVARICTRAPTPDAGDERVRTDRSVCVDMLRDSGTELVLVSLSET